MKVPDEAIDVLANSEIIGNNLFLPPTQLERKLYVSVNKALEALGGKWVRKEKSHAFQEDPAEAIEQLLQTGEYVCEKKEFQFFETPEWLAKKMVTLANIQPGDRALEPSAGRGAIARFMPGCSCIELNPKHYQELAGAGYSMVGDDFLTFNDPTYDIIVMNPPFSNQQDIDHVTHAFNLARLRVVAIASASVLFRTNRKTEEFRDLVNRYGTIEPLPDGAFKEAGTMVRTCLVQMEQE